ncbi:hypothetical protein ES703_70227 [subsurface metagenome]
MAKKSIWQRQAEGRQIPVLRRMISKWGTMGAIAALATVVFCQRTNANQTAECFSHLPPGWSVRKSFVVPRNQTAAIEKRLSCSIKRLSNTILAVRGQQIQVNILECYTDEDAEKLRKTILKMKAHKAFCLRNNKSVIEFVGDSVALATKAAYELGFTPKPVEVRYRISAEMVPLEKCDYMAFNNLFNLFLAIKRNPDDHETKVRIADISKGFQFGKKINLRTCGNDKSKPIYRFGPNPIKTRLAGHGDVTTYTFEKMPLVLAIPHVSVEMELTTHEEGITPSIRKAGGELLASSEFWPVNDSEISALAKKITKGCQSNEDKVEAILKWLTPGKNIEFGGPVEGSRWGVKKVLKQGFGQCWDFSDCFITLARASGIPCRQVAGWLYGCSGHIWAEVVIEGKGWQQVDPTGGSVLKCGIYHIPYFTSEDGNMPILYVSMPRIEMLDQ